MRTFALLVAVALLVGAAAQEVYNVRACTASPGEQAFCESALDLMNAAGEGRINFSCVEFGSSDECLEAIARGDADWRTSDSGDIFYAWEELGLRAIVSENYGKSGVTGGEYYAIAVVRAEMCEDESVTLGSLRGMRSCHTGYRKTAGWRMPLGMLMANDHITPFNNDDDIENDAEMIADFFSTSCAPRTSGNGPINTEDGAGALWDELCSGCINPNVTEEDRCTSRDAYYNYPGALRCLMEDSGDVAFIKHTTVPDFAADGATPAEWATLSSDDLRIMCVSGGCAPIANWSDCNLARVPAHAVVANPLSPFVEDGTLADVLVDLSMVPEFQAVAFNGTTNEEDYLFKSSTQSLDRIDGDTGSYLGAAALAFEFLETVDSA